MCPTTECPSCTCPADDLDNREEAYICRPSTDVTEMVLKAREEYPNELGNIKSGCKEQVSDVYVVISYTMSYVEDNVVDDNFNNDHNDHMVGETG